MTTLVMLVIGLVLLVIGAEALVRGSSRLAAMLGISPLVIGLTVVAFGTSSPELATSLQSTAQGQVDIALGNVLGSNIFNILVILGLSAVITPLVVAQQLVRLDVPLMLGLSIAMWLMAANGVIGRGEGVLLVAGLVVYTIFLVRQSRRETTAVQQEYDAAFGNGRNRSTRVWLVNLTLALVGLGLLVLGSRWLVEGAVTLARSLGLSELIIGLTIIAAGTSLPEVATSVMAALRGERDIAVGNVVGSNIFNLLAVLGVTTIFSPAGVPVSTAALAFDLPVMVVVALAALPIFITGNRIDRWEGLLFLGYYVAYTVYLVLDASAHDALPVFSTTLLWFAAPLTLVTLAIALFRDVRQRQTAVP